MNRYFESEGTHRAYLEFVGGYMRSRRDLTVPECERMAMWLTASARWNDATLL